MRLLPDSLVFLNITLKPLLISRSDAHFPHIAHRPAYPRI